MTKPAESKSPGNVTELTDEKGSLVGFVYEPTEQEQKITQAWLAQNTVPEVVSGGPYYGVQKK